MEFEVEHNLLNFKSNYRDLDEFWGECDEEDETGPTGNEGNTRNSWYHSYLILAIPPNRTFEVLCKKSFDESLTYLVKDLSSDFNLHVKTFLEVFKRHTYNEENMIKVMELLARTANADIIKTFCLNVLERENHVPYYLMRNESYEKTIVGLNYPGTVDAFSSVLRSVTWEDVKPFIENMIPRCKLNQLSSWLKCAELSVQQDITQSR